MTNEESRVRRRAIANAIADGASVGAAALRFKVSDQTVRWSCHIHDVHLPKRDPSGGKITVYEIIAALQGGRTDSEITRDLGVHRGVVARVHDRCCRFGVNLKGANDNG